MLLNQKMAPPPILKWLAGRMVITQLFYLALAQGINSVVERDGTVLSGLYSLQTDSETEVYPALLAGRSGAR